MADVYQIAMELDLDDKASEGLKGITESLTKIVEQLALAKEGFSALNTAVLGAAGAGIILGLSKIAMAADAVEDSFTRLKQGGIDTIRALEAVDRTRAMVPTVGREQAADRLRTMYGFMGERAFGFLPEYNRLAEVFRFQQDPGGERAVLQLAAQRGLTGPGHERQLRAFMDEQLKTMEATGGIATPEKMLMVSRMSGIVGQQMSPEMMNVVMPWLMMTGVGGRLGPGRAFAALAEGALSASRGKAGLSGGQINQAGMLATFGRTMGGADVTALAQNPLEWARRELPVMQARGLLGGTPEQNEQFILQMMMRIFKNAQTAQIMAVLFNNLMQGSASSLAQFAAQRGRALGAEDAYGVQQETTSEKVLALGKSFGLLMDAISEKIKPTFNAQVDALRGFFDVMTRFVHNTPAGVLRATAVGLEVLGASLILLAGARVFAALTAFAFGGWAAVGIAAIIALIGMLATLDWQAVGTMLEKIYNAIYRFLQKIGLIAKDDVTAATPHRQPATANFLIPSVTQTDPLLKRILPQWMQDWAGSTGRMNVPSNLPGLGWLPSTLQTRQEEKQAITMHLSLELDGQVLASAVAQGMVSYGQFPHTGAASNGWSGWPGTDQNILPR